MTNLFHASFVRWLVLLPPILALLWLARSAVRSTHERLPWYHLFLRVLGAVAGSVVLLLGVAVNLGWFGR